MAIQDAKLLFGESVDIGSVNNSADLDFTNTISLGSLKDAFGGTITNDAGEGGGLWLNVYCEDEAWTASSSTTLTLALQKASSVDGSSDLSSATTVLSKTVAITGSGSTGPTDGQALWRIQIPAGALGPHIGLNVANSGADMSAGKLTAWIGMDSKTPESSY